MYRASTPTHTFTFDVDPDSTFKDILISYSQNGTVILNKTKEDLTFDGNDASLTLTQTETNLFVKDVNPVVVQVRVLTYEDESIPCEKMYVALQDVLNDEVMT